MFSKIHGLSGSTLKLLAIFLMLIDHIGVVLFPNYLILRIIGRGAFPIFCFLLVEGFYHTHSKWHYASRLALFAIISQIPFSLVVTHTCFSLNHLNVFFTLFIGLLALMGMNFYSSSIFKQIVIIICSCFIAEMLHTDYGAIGVVTIVLFYQYHTHQNFVVLALKLLLIYLLVQGIQIFAILALIPIFFYNGKKGLSLKYVFYIFYPLHLLILYFLGEYIFL